MTIQRNRSLFVLFSAVFILLLATAGVQAEVQTIVSTVRQSFSDSPSSESARVVATARARRDVLEKAGTYFENLAAVKKQGIAKEEIPALAAGILETELTSQKSYAAEGAFVFEITAGVKVNTAILEAQATRFLKDRDLLKKYQAALKRESDLLATISALEAEARKPGNAPPDKKEAQKIKMKAAAGKLSAVAWYARALDLTSHQTVAGQTSEEAAGYLIKAVSLDPEYAEALFWLGSVHAEKGEYGRAADYYQKVLAMEVKTGGENHPDVAAAYNRLGLARHRNAEYDLAMAAYRQAWKIQIQTLGENHPDVATTYNNMGETYRRKGEYDRAIEYYMKDLEITLKAQGRNHPNVATTYNNLGYAYHGKGDNDRAMEYFQKALEVCRISLGENHPQTKTIMENIEFLKNNPQSPAR